MLHVDVQALLRLGDHADDLKRGKKRRARRVRSVSLLLKGEKALRQLHSLKQNAE